MLHRRVFWFVIGASALLLGALGVVLPLLPTTPFVLVAAYAFAQSSDRCHQWLLDHPLFGSLIANWRVYGAISRRAKILTVISMMAVLLISIGLGVPPLILLVQIVVLGASGTFVLTRPLPPENTKSAEP